MMEVKTAAVLTASGILSAAVEAAKRGDRNKASALIDEVERRAAPWDGNEAQRKLIEALRQRFGLQISVKPAVSKMVPDKPGPSLPGVSLVTCCKNRTENLIKALPTWLAHPRINEVVIVDWSSDVEVARSLSEAGISDPRIRVVRADDEPRWILSYAFNLGFRLARHDLILKVDADITLKPDFFERNQLKERIFIAGNWEAAEKGQEHINGFFYVHRVDLLRIKGFNEYITTYGWDDDDIYSRLAQSGIARVCVDTKSIYHIPHDDAQRIGSVSGKKDNAHTQLHTDTLFKIRCNRYLAMVMPAWNGDRIFAPFEVAREAPGYIQVRRRKDQMPHLVNDDIRLDAEHHAAFELVSWKLGTSVYHLSRAAFNRLLELKRLEHISRFDLDIALLGGRAFDSLRRHSLFISLDGMTRDDLLDPLASQVLAQLDAADASIYVSGGSVDQRDAMMSALRGRAVRLDQWVRTDGLHALNGDDLKRLKALVAEGAGASLKVTDQILLQAATFTAAPPAVRSSTPQRRRLYLDAQHGLGNRLRAFASAIAVARATDREPVLIWTPDNHCECRFSDLFEYDGLVIEDAGSIRSPDLKRITYMELEPGAVKDQPIDLDTDADVLVRSAYVLNHPTSSWEKENAILRELRPSSAVQALVDSVDARGCLGAHVRMEAGKGLDHNSYDASTNWSKDSHDAIHFWRDKSHYSAFFRRIDELFAKNPGLNLFLATDLAENYTAFLTRYGQRVRYLERQVYDRSREQIIYALADAILLSRCDLLLGSTWSSFSELAMRLSTSFSKIEMSGKDF